MHEHDGRMNAVFGAGVVPVAETAEFVELETGETQTNATENVEKAEHAVEEERVVSGLQGVESETNTFDVRVATLREDVFRSDFDLVNHFRDFVTLVRSQEVGVRVEVSIGEELYDILSLDVLEGRAKEPA